VRGTAASIGPRGWPELAREKGKCENRGCYLASRVYVVARKRARLLPRAADRSTFSGDVHFSPVVDPVPFCIETHQRRLKRGKREKKGETMA